MLLPNIVSDFRKYGELWYPKPHSVMCSDHFVGNLRSKDPSIMYHHYSLKSTKEKILMVNNRVTGINDKESV